MEKRTVNLLYLSLSTTGHIDKFMAFFPKKQVTFWHDSNLIDKWLFLEEFQ